MVMSKLFRFGRRQLHTIVSRDIIKPSSPTPSHLKTYNLSLLDQVAVNAYMPMVTFYPNSSTYRSPCDKTLDLKNSLSQTLTQYYPFAGRLAKNGPAYVDCNDEGVEFLEAHNDSPLSDFLQNSEHEALDQLFPNDLVWYKSNYRVGNADQKDTSLLAVQVNHFACGGIAVAVSLYHKISDAISLINFFNHWATVTRSRLEEHQDASLINPHFIPYQSTNIELPKLPDRPAGDFVTRSFLFANTKLKDLKAKVTSMTAESGQPIMNLTRAEVLTWLLHNCAVAAATKTNSGSSKSTGVMQPFNLRNNMIELLPGTTVGNLYLMMEYPTRNDSEMTPNAIIGELKKQKTEFQELRNMETILGVVMKKYSETGIEESSNRFHDSYIYSVLSKYPAYEIDFGWGKPVKTTFAGNVKKLSVLLDAPNGDGIEALVSLEKQDMAIFQKDPELLAFC